MEKEVLTEIRYNRFNEDYIIIPVSELKQMIYFCEWNIEEKHQTDEVKRFFIRKKEIFKYALSIITTYNKKTDNIVMNKNSSLYKELFTNTRKIIDLNMIENAYLIAVIEQNTAIISKITKLKEEIQQFKESKKRNNKQKLNISVGICIYHSEIATEFGQDVADYIWENDSLEDYQKVQNGALPHEEDRHVFLYENGKIEEVDLPVPNVKENKVKKKINI